MPIRVNSEGSEGPAATTRFAKQAGLGGAGHYTSFKDGGSSKVPESTLGPCAIPTGIQKTFDLGFQSAPMKTTLVAGVGLGCDTYKAGLRNGRLRSKKSGLNPVT